MKKTFHALGALTIAAALNLFTTACTNDDNFVNDEPQAEQPAAVKTYQVNIPATMPSDGTRAVTFDGTTSSRTFNENEKVYVYNASTDEVMGGYLQPTDISADGKSCKLTGTLSGGTISNGDNLKLMYNLSHVSTDKTNNHYKLQTFFDYSTQDGTQAGVIDGAEATVTAGSFTGGVLTTTADAQFTNVQSMFRQRLTFKSSSNETVTPTIKKLEITSKKNKLSKYYKPVNNNDGVEGVLTFLNPTIDANGDIYLALRILSSDDTDALTFTATDTDDNVYECTKNEPSGGFENGKYYHGAMTMAYARKASQPIVTGTNVTPNKNGMYDISTTDDVTISGNSSGYYFYFTWGLTVTLDNLTAAYSGTNTFLYANQNLDLVVNGTNNISATNASYAIFANGTLKLSGNGTLTVTANNWKYGINYTGSNFPPGTDAVDVTSVLAADGYTVSRSACSGNSTDGYTWTYTVAPATNP